MVQGVVAATVQAVVVTVRVAVVMAPAAAETVLAEGVMAVVVQADPAARVGPMALYGAGSKVAAARGTVEAAREQAGMA